MSHDHDQPHDHGHDHEPIGHDGEPPAAARVRALEGLLVEKGVITREAVRQGVDWLVSRSPGDGAKLVAHAWVDPAFKERLLTDARAAAGELGLDLRVASIAIRPGKPTFFGLLSDGRRILGLPGNPASAFVCAELFLKPILARYLGADAGLRTIKAKLETALPANGPREHWMRAQLSFANGEATVQPYRDQDSSLITIFAAANALLRRPPESAPSSAGELGEVLPLARA